MHNVAIIGAGHMGRVHADAYSRITGANVAFVVDVNIEKAKDFARDFGCAWTDAISNIKGTEVDVADICVPTPYHKESIEKVSCYVKNIICEKPLVLDPNQVKEIEELVRKKDLTFMVAQVVRFWNGYALAKRLLDQGALGEIRSIVCTRRQKPPGWSTDNWINKRELSGGPAFDLIIHDLDYISWVMGCPEYVLGSELTDENGNILHVKSELIYENATATVFGSLGMPKQFGKGMVFFTMEIVGTKAMVSLDSNNNFVIINDHEVRAIELESENAYEQELKYFIKCIDQGKKPDMANIYQARIPLEISAAIVRSSRERCLVEMVNNRYAKDL